MAHTKYPVKRVSGKKMMVAVVSCRLQVHRHSGTSQSREKAKNVHDFIHLVRCNLHHSNEHRRQEDPKRVTHIEGIINQILRYAREHIQASENIFHMIKHVRLSKPNVNIPLLSLSINWKRLTR
jgi:hypothetical protein